MYTATIGNTTASKCSISGKLSLECVFFVWKLGVVNFTLGPNSGISTNNNFHLVS